MNTPEKKPAFRLWSTVNTVNAEVLCCAVRYALGHEKCQKGDENGATNEIMSVLRLRHYPL